VPAWPNLEGTIKADSLILGPVTLEQPSATLRILNTGAEITAFDAGILGGRVHGAGTVTTGNAKATRPEYALTGTFEKLNPVAVGELLGQQWSGGTLNADGKVDLTGFTGTDLAASAKGTLHFEWRHGTMIPGAGMPGAGAQGDLPGRFERWTGNAEIAGGKVAVTDNQMVEGGKARKAEGSVQLAEPVKFTFATPKETQAKR